MQDENLWEILHQGKSSTSNQVWPGRTREQVNKILILEHFFYLLSPEVREWVKGHDQEMAHRTQSGGDLPRCKTRNQDLPLYDPAKPHWRQSLALCVFGFAFQIQVRACIKPKKAANRLKSFISVFCQEDMSALVKPGDSVREPSKKEQVSVLYVKVIIQLLRSVWWPVGCKCAHTISVKGTLSGVERAQVQKGEKSLRSEGNPVFRDRRSKLLMWKRVAT